MNTVSEILKCQLLHTKEFWEMNLQEGWIKAMLSSLSVVKIQLYFIFLKSVMNQHWSIRLADVETCHTTRAGQWQIVIDFFSIYSQFLNFSHHRPVTKSSWTGLSSWTTLSSTELKDMLTMNSSGIQGWLYHLVKLVVQALCRTAFSKPVEESCTSS